MRRECSRPSAAASRLPYLRRGAFILVSLLPWLWPFTPGPSPNVVPLLVAWCCMMTGLLLAARPGGPDADTLHRDIATAWLAAAAISACLALAQWFAVAPDTRWISPARLGEAYANLRQKNHFASLTSLGFAALVFGIRERTPQWRRALLVLLAAGNAASASRTGLLQWVAIAGLAFCWSGSRPQRTRLAATGLVLYLLAAWSLPALLRAAYGHEAVNALDRAMADLGCSSRMVLWSNVLQLIAARPWTGWGPGELDYAHYITLYPAERFCDILDNAHNLPLHLAVEFGVPAAGLAVAGLVAVLAWASPWRDRRPAAQLGWAAVAIVGLHSLVEYPLWYGPFQAALVLAALLVGGPSPERLRPLVLVLALGTWLGSWIAWSDYDKVSQAYLPPEARRPAMRQDPVAAAGDPVLFRDQLDFARLSTMPVDRASAPLVYRLSQDLLHYSPEPMVIEKLVESALLLGREQEALFHAARYKAAFPQRYRSWVSASPAASSIGNDRR